MTTIEIQQEQAPITKQWLADGTSMSIEFAVKTFWGLGTVRGRFDRFSGSYTRGPDGARMELTIEADSIDTGNGTRDEHLRSPDFFDAARHRYVRFISTSVEELADGTTRISGRLEAAGRSMPIELDATLRKLGSELEVEASTTVDQRRFEMSSGPLAMIRPPARIHVTGTAHAV
jgi:polyisoprenoid-binding protein YceI